MKTVKDRAEHSSDAESRGSWANRAIDVAAVSKSVDLMKSVMIWGRRFLRDPVRPLRMIDRYVPMRFNDVEVC